MNHEIRWNQQRSARTACYAPAAPPKFEVKRYGASGHSNDCMPVPPGSYSASNFAGAALHLPLDHGYGFRSQVRLMRLIPTVCLDIISLVVRSCG
jgi:hypothetical protein